MKIHELKLCPFCEGEATLEYWQARKGFEASIFCGNCLANIFTVTCDEEEEAILEVVEKWNRRAEQ